MPYITREDGEHFVIPSYRDVLSAKQKSVLKKDILLLSQSYGEYITLQKKGTMQYEVAFSPDPGYLLGESIWHYFKRPLDMIYCEAIPNTTEAIVVIVKAGSVYLDGSFPLDSIPEELVIFLTQQNNFEIYLSGDVPISQEPVAGKFSFEANAIKSFTILEKPIFPTLPLLKAYQLQLVDVVLKSHGIGVFPTRQLFTMLIMAGLGWMLWSYITTKREELPPPPPPVNPYQEYNTSLTSPPPDQAIQQFLNRSRVLFSLPGWQVTSMLYTKGIITAMVQSNGGKVQDLFDWAKSNKAIVNLQPNGVTLALSAAIPNRSMPTKIYPIKQIVGIFVDRLATVYPGNNMKLDQFVKKAVFTDVLITINIRAVSPVVVALIGNQLKDLPFVLQSITVNVDNGSLTGSIIIEALGS